MVSPLEAKPISVEIGKTRDHDLERFRLVWRRRRERRALSDVA
jgi:hypothetical protein